jgi:hypothetical protein
MIAGGAVPVHKIYMVNAQTMIFSGEPVVKICLQRSMVCVVTRSRTQGGVQEEDEDLFADDGEDEDTAKEEMRQRAADARAAAKAGGPPAKTNIVLDVKGKFVCNLLFISKSTSK